MTTGIGVEISGLLLCDANSHMIYRQLSKFYS